MTDVAPPPQPLEFRSNPAASRHAAAGRTRIGFRSLMLTGTPSWFCKACPYQPRHGHLVASAWPRPFLPWCTKSLVAGSCRNMAPPFLCRGDCLAPLVIPDRALVSMPQPPRASPCGANPKLCIAARFAEPVEFSSFHEDLSNDHIDVLRHFLKNGARQLHPVARLQRRGVLRVSCAGCSWVTIPTMSDIAPHHRPPGSAGRPLA